MKKLILVLCALASSSAFADNTESMLKKFNGDFSFEKCVNVTTPAWMRIPKDGDTLKVETKKSLNNYAYTLMLTIKAPSEGGYGLIKTIDVNRAGNEIVRINDPVSGDMGGGCNKGKAKIYLSETNLLHRESVRRYWMCVLPEGESIDVTDEVVLELDTLRYKFFDHVDGYGYECLFNKLPE